MSRNARVLPTTTIDSIVEKLPLSPVHTFIIITAALGFMFDSFDTYRDLAIVDGKRVESDAIMVGMQARANFLGMLLGLRLGTHHQQVWPQGRFYQHDAGLELAQRAYGFRSRHWTVFGVPVHHGNVPGRHDSGRYGAGLRIHVGQVPRKIRGCTYRFWPFGLLAAAIASLTWFRPRMAIMFILGVVPAALSLW